MRAAALRAFLRRLSRDHYVAAVFAVPRRDTIAPPQLPRDAPVIDVAHPLEVRLGVILRNELDFALFNRFDGAVGQRLNLDKPLGRKPRLDDRFATVALTERHYIVFRSD